MKAAKYFLCGLVLGVLAMVSLLQVSTVQASPKNHNYNSYKQENGDPEGGSEDQKQCLGPQDEDCGPGL